MVSPERIAELDDVQARMAMVHYSFLVQAYVWGAEPPARPAARARRPDRGAGRPARRSSRLLQYSGYVLDNWGMLDRAKGVSLDNIYMIQKFAAGTDEAWFVLVHVAIEARAGAALALFAPADRRGGERRCGPGGKSCLGGSWRSGPKSTRSSTACPSNAIPTSISAGSGPTSTAGRTIRRSAAASSTRASSDSGDAPQAFRGQTGSQSSIVPSMDALLGVGHAADPLRAYLDELHIYRPPGHRRFIDDVRAQSDVRAFVKRSGRKGLTEAYNAAVQAVADFRSRHLEYAASYIT